MSQTASRHDQIQPQFFHKFAHIILQSRLGLALNGKTNKWVSFCRWSKRSHQILTVNRIDRRIFSFILTLEWLQFNLITTDTDSLREDLRFWKAQAISSPQPLFIDIFLDLSQFDHLNHVLLLKTPHGYQRVANEALMNSIRNSSKKSILLETWRLMTTV